MRRNLCQILLLAVRRVHEAGCVRMVGDLDTTRPDPIMSRQYVVRPGSADISVVGTNPARLARRPSKRAKNDLWRAFTRASIIEDVLYTCVLWRRSISVEHCTIRTSSRKADCGCGRLLSITTKSAESCRRGSFRPNTTDTEV